MWALKHFGISASSFTQDNTFAEISTKSSTEQLKCVQCAFPDGLLRTNMNLQFAGVGHVEGPEPLAIQLHQYETTLRQKISSFQDLVLTFSAPIPL